MVALRSSGQGNYKLTWQGATVRNAIDSAVQEAMDNLAEEIRAYLQATLHRITSRMANESFAEVEVRGGKRTLSLGSDAPYTIYHELRYHPQLRETADLFAPQVTPRIQAALRKV